MVLVIAAGVEKGGVFAGSYGVEYWWIEELLRM